MFSFLFFYFKGIKNNVHRVKHLTLNSNEKSEEIQSKFDYEKKRTFKINDYNHRIMLAHHQFHANIKRTLTRWIRETPV